MPDNVPCIGDLYWTFQAAIQGSSSLGKSGRPLLCVATPPADPDIWRGMPRLSSGIGMIDCPSPAMPELHPTRLNREGAWSYRWVHPVLRTATGVHGKCEYLATLPKEHKSVAMDHYHSRRNK